MLAKQAKSKDSRISNFRRWEFVWFFFTWYLIPLSESILWPRRQDKPSFVIIGSTTTHISENGQNIFWHKVKTSHVVVQNLKTRLVFIDEQYHLQWNFQMQNYLVSCYPQKGTKSRHHGLWLLRRGMTQSVNSFYQAIYQEDFDATFTQKLSWWSFDSEDTEIMCITEVNFPANDNCHDQYKMQQGRFVSVEAAPICNINPFVILSATMMTLTTTTMTMAWWLR